MRTAVLASPGSEFHEFLYAPICQEQEGMTLSVLSALARQDVDPWTEAARLSRLPLEGAVKEMIGFLDALPRRTLDCLDRVEIAGRLCALLPGRAAPKASAVNAPPPAEKNGLSLNWRFLGVYISLMMLVNWVIAEYVVAPADSGSMPAAVASSTPPPASLAAQVPTLQPASNGTAAADRASPPP